MSRSRNRATLGNPLSGLRSRDGNEVPLSITTQKALNASSVSATASLLSQGTQPIAAGTPRRRTARCSSSTSQSPSTIFPPNHARHPDSCGPHARGFPDQCRESLVVAERHPIHRASVCLLVSGDHPATPKTRRRPSLPRRPLLFEL